MLDLLAFDLDGVLVDTSPCHARAWSDVWARLRIDGPPYQAIAGRSTRDVLTEVAGGGPDPEALVTFKQERAREYLAVEDVLYPDTREAVRAMRTAARRLGIGTSASRRNTELVLARAGLSGAFDAIVTGDDVPEGKPAPAVYRALMALAGATPASTLVVEDSEAGVAAGLASGARVVTVRSGCRSESPRFAGAFPDLASLARALASRAEVG